MLQLSPHRERRNRRHRATHRRLGGAGHPVVEPASAFVDQMIAVPLVASEQLVAAFAGQHHLDVLGRQFGHKIQRDARRKADRLVLVPDHLRHRAEKLVEPDDNLVMLGAEQPRHLRRPSEFAELGLLIAYRERLHRSVEPPLHDRGDAARVDTSAEEYAERHVRHQPALDALLEARAALGDPLSRVALFGLVKQRRFPILADSQVEPVFPAFEGEIVRRGELFHAREQGIVRAHVSEREVLRQRGFVERRPDRGMLEQGLDLGPEHESGSVPPIVKRLDPVPVARAKQRLLLAIPHRVGEHSIEAGDARRSVLLVAVDNRLGVTPRAVAVSGPLEIGAEAGVVEDLPVIDDPKGIGLVRHRLMSGGQIDDAQAAVSEIGVVVVVVPGIVRSPVLDRVRHAAQHRQRIGPRPGADEPRDSTHIYRAATFSIGPIR